MWTCAVENVTAKLPKPSKHKRESSQRHTGVSPGGAYLDFPAMLDIKLEKLPPMTSIRQSIALLAICTVLVIATASVLPGHEHAGDTARACDVCQSGHLPCLQPSGEIQLHVQTPVVWQQTQQDFERHLDSASVIRAPRAPPA